jgi:HK97 family phage portal protein
MNLSWLPSLFNRGKIAPVDPARNSTVFQPLGFVPSELRLSIEEQISVSMVWACIRNIVDPIASSDVNVFTVDSKGRKQLPDEALVYLLNVRPNPDLTAQAFKEILLTETLINGNGFAEIVKDKAGRVAELWPLPTDAVKVTRDASGLVYVVAQQDGITKTLTAAEVIHVRGPSVRGFVGDSLVFRAAKAVALAVAQEQFASAYYINNTVLGGTIEIPGRMDDETRKVLSADWKAKYAGKKKAHGVAVLEGGAKFVSFNVEADKAQLIPSRTFSVEDVARYFGVPLVRLGVQAAAQGYGTNVSQLNLQFVRDTLTPWVNRFCEEVAFKCYPERKPWRTLEVDLQWLTLGDAMQRAQAYEVLIRTGVKTVNECRAIEGDNSIGPDGDFNLISTGLMILDEENLAKPEPPAPAGPPGQPPTVDPEADPADPTEAPEDAAGTALDSFRKKINARLADLKRAGHGPEVLAAHTAQLVEKALGTVPGDPQNVRTALAAVAAGATNQQAMFSLRVP